MFPFVPGLALSRDYYAEIVAPAVASVVPGVPYSAALMGDGSEVQGFDTERSSDHDWGPHVMLFFDRTHISEAQRTLLHALPTILPSEFRGHATQFHRGDPTSPGGPFRLGAMVRGVEVFEPAAWVVAHLGADPRKSRAPVDWLAMPWNLLRGVVGGDVFYDGLGELGQLRDAAHWYPPELGRYVVACQWQRINQEEPFAGRAAEAGAHVGSHIVAMRQVREVMHLCFLLERRFPPYSKWLEPAFAELACASVMMPLLVAAIQAPSWTVLQDALCAIYLEAARLHNNTEMSAPVAAEMQTFHDRPYRVLNAHRFVDATLCTISDAVIRGLPLWGSVSQCVDSADVLASASEARRFYHVFAANP